MKKKNIFLLGIPFVLLWAYLDLILINRMTLKEYIFQCLWEYTIFWLGFWCSEKLYLKQKYEVK